MPFDRDVLIHDSELKGFHLKITPRGKRVFYVYYRTKGARVQQRRYKIGDYPAVSVSRARELAKAVLGRVASGDDPSAERQSDRHRLNTGRVDEIVERFLTTYVSKNRTATAEWRRWGSHRTLPTKFSITRRGPYRVRRRCTNVTSSSTNARTRWIGGLHTYIAGL